ncbi:MAG: acyltransferase family protein, partial [Lachnospiraceae bacterium]|nr:acyltransferase family protein [Lachnospiraceae bacterium]
MEEKNKISHKRNSNIEMLRIICILLVILRHYSTQVNWDNFTCSNWSLRVLFLQIITIGGSTANNIFLLISGYFMISKKINYKRIVMLIIEMTFYSISILILLYSLKLVPF